MIESALLSLNNPLTKVVLASINTPLIQRVSFVTLGTNKGRINSSVAQPIEIIQDTLGKQNSIALL